MVGIVADIAYVIVSIQDILNNISVFTGCIGRNHVVVCAVESFQPLSCIGALRILIPVVSFPHALQQAA